MAWRPLMTSCYMASCISGDDDLETSASEVWMTQFPLSNGPFPFLLCTLDTLYSSSGSTKL